MARLPIIAPENATGKTHDLLATVKQKFGLVPNSMGVMANSPAVLEAYLKFSGSLDGGSLDAKLRERIALETAEANCSDYCLSAHSAIGKMVGLTATEILDSRRVHSEDTKTSAALRFSRVIIEKRGAVSETDFKSARSAGLGEGEIAEVLAVTVLNIFTNYFNTAFHVDIDFPVVKTLTTVTQ
jgi:AhpD family alkylhydroperoxidase